MFFITTHRILQSFALPPLNVILLLLVGLVIVCWHKKTASVFIASAIIMLYLQSTPFFVYHLANLVELPHISKTQLDEAEGIVVLGGGTKTNAQEYKFSLVPNSWTLMRLHYAAYIAKQYPNKIIVVSGGMYNNKRNSEADVMARVLHDDYQLNNPIIIEDKSMNTIENAKFVTNILKKLQIYNVIVITQALHAKRATALFTKYGMHVVAAPTDYSASYRNNNSIYSFIPNANAMHTCAQLLHEIYGYIIYVD